MLLMMLERNEPIHSVVFFDTGWEFPEMHEHIEKLERYTDLSFVRLKPEKSFDYLLTKQPVIARSGDKKGQIHRYGYGWPAVLRRWCTRLKINAIEKYYRKQSEFASCIGFAADEYRRIPPDRKKKWAERYPLIEYDVTEQEAIQYCYKNGFDWGGLYEIFGRVSCFCCPLQRLGELRMLRKKRPELWERMLVLDKGLNRGFRGLKTVRDLESRFFEEDMQRLMFDD